MYNYTKYLLLFLSILSLFIEVYLTIYFDEVYDKRLFILNMLFIQVLAFPTTIIALPVLFGMSILISYLFPNLELNTELSTVFGHILFVFLVYLQWFILIPKINKWFQIFKNKGK